LEAILGKVNETISLQNKEIEANNNNKRSGGVTQVLEHLPNTHEAGFNNPVPQNKTKQKKSYSPARLLQMPRSLTSRRTTPITLSKHPPHPTSLEISVAAHHLVVSSNLLRYCGTRQRPMSWNKVHSLP
jgi:hypothetical protein